MAHRWQVLIVTSVAVFMSFLDVTIVNIAFPDIAAGFPSASLPHLSWILNAYAILFAAALVPAGRLADRFGRRRSFFAGLLLFLAASALCGAAWSPDVLIAMRALQALGAALLVPASLALVLPEFPLDQRATATALWGATGGIAAAAGPSLGGLLVDWQGWRWVFFVNLVVGIPALLPALRLLRESREEEGGAPDAVGAVLLTTAVAALALAIVEGPDWGWSSARVLGAFAASGVLGVLFLLRGATHPRPVVELGLFRVRSFAVSNAAVLVFALGFYALLLASALFLTGVWDYSIARAGFAFTPGPFAATLAAPVCGRLSDRFGQRVVAVPGAFLFAAGAFLLAFRLGAEPAYASEYLPGIALAGAGVGATFAALASASVAELPPDRFATGTAVFNTFRQIGAVIGVSGLVAVLDASAVDGPLTAFQRAWALIGAVGALAALAAVALGRARPAAETAPDAAPSRVPSG